MSALTAVRGIGPWTVDMFSMFHLGRPDVLPVGDLAVRKVRGPTAPQSAVLHSRMWEQWYALARTTAC
jgi:DNA-3-methyladenine glycosylase II